MSDKKPLTAQQEAYLDALFGEARGDCNQARKIAEYSSTYPVSKINDVLKDHIYERTLALVKTGGPKAVFALFDAIDTPSAMGVRNQIAAANSILDRMGIAKHENVNLGVAAKDGLAILPEKDAPKSE